MQRISELCGVTDISKIIADDMPNILKHIKDNFGFSDLGKELSAMGKENADEIARRLKSWSIPKLKQDDIERISQRFSGLIESKVLRDLPNESLYEQLKGIIADLAKDLEDNDEEEEKQI